MTSLTSRTATYSVVFVTVPSTELGRKIAHALLSERLIACANIVPQVTSIYRWQGKIEEAQELLMVMKTRAGSIKQVVDRVKALHSYDVPEVISVPIEDGNPAYMQWIRDNTAE